MNERQELVNRIKVVTDNTFVDLALDIYAYQYANNETYREFVSLWRGEGFRPKVVADIPFLPISFFKSRTVKSSKWDPELVYKSSATTGMVRSRHYVRDVGFYHNMALRAFKKYYGNIEEFEIFALLPGYIERGESSLVSMAHHFIKESKGDHGGFFLENTDQMLKEIDLARKKSKKLLLLGVSFALWKLASEKHDLSDVIVMETGGMKGKGPEMPKDAFHTFLKEGFSISEVHSEYGMTEMLSQGYSQGHGIFDPAETLQIHVSEINDPLSWNPSGKAGILHVVDLMNIDSCSFIRTEDLGIVFENGKFRILGRLDASEIRGCNLLVSDL